MPNVLVLDLETVTQSAHAERVLNEPFPADTWKPTGNASRPETIARQKEEAEAAWDAGRLERVDALCLSPRTGRVVCAGIWPECDPFLASEEGTEKVLLGLLWRAIHESQTLVTYNGFAFDLPYLINRSALLGVTPLIAPQRLTGLLRRYSYSPHFDVRMALAAWDTRAPGKKAEWAAAFGLTPQEGDGSMVGQWYRAGQFDKIAEHCRADVTETMHMFERLRPFYLGA